MTTLLAPESRCAPSQPAAQVSSMWRLFIISFASLYLEIVLIRWLGTEVKIFAFFQNLALITCFLGFGVGCFTSKMRGSILPSLAAITTLVVIVLLPFKPWHSMLSSISAVLSSTPEAALFGAWQGATFASPAYYYESMVVSLLAVAALLILVCIAMVPLGRRVGWYLETAPHTVGAYSLNLLGSLLGIWLLALLAFLWLPPWCWFGVAFVLIMMAEPFSWRSALPSAVLLVITISALALVPANRDAVYWSPYQKLTVHSDGDQQYTIDVNDAVYMTIANASPPFLAQHPELARQYPNSSYDSPFQFAKKADRVLVVGSGAGNDVAAALRHGASQVDAVEIDPLIYAAGRRLHPEQPYTSPKVRLFNTDARNFMRQSNGPYDVIIFALLDSHTQFSGYSNMRIDNYVYTKESFEDAKRLLGKDGILILKFEVRDNWTWIGQRFYAMLTRLFGRPPVTYYADNVGSMLHATVFVESASPELWDGSAQLPSSAFLASHPPGFTLTGNTVPPPTTDDWPYLYHYGHSIPRAYFSVSALILLIACYMVWPFFRPGEGSALQFFLLGAGFLLMETQLVSRLALYFGTTWLVNCVALTGILGVLLLANLYIEHRPPLRLGPFYAYLCVALLIDYALPWTHLPGSATAIGSLLCIAYCIPVFFAGIIFTESFRRYVGRSAAFGANMLGAVAGGLAQNLSFIFGMKALLLVAMFIYGAAGLIHLRKPIPSMTSDEIAQ